MNLNRIMAAIGMFLGALALGLVLFRGQGRNGAEGRSDSGTALPVPPPGGREGHGLDARATALPLPPPARGGGERYPRPDATQSPIPSELAAVFDKSQKPVARMKALDALPGSARSPESLAALRWLMWERKEDAGVRNSAAEKLREWDEEHIAGDLTAMLWDMQESARWRNDCVQRLYECYAESGQPEVLNTILDASLADEKTVVICALWSLARVATLSDEGKLPDNSVLERIHQSCLAALQDERAELLVRVAGVQSCAWMKLPETLAECRKIMQDDNPKAAYLRMVAVAAIGDLGDMNDAKVLHKLAAMGNTPLVKGAALKTVERILARVSPMKGGRTEAEREAIAEALRAPPPRPATPVVAAAPGAEHGPHLVFDKLAWDFVREMAGHPVVANNEYTNEGDETLHISDIHFGCGCSVVDGKYDKTLEPGQRGKLPVSMGTAYLNGDVSKTISVSCNDREQNMFVLILRGSVWQPFDILPHWPSLGTFTEEDKELTATVRIIRKLPDAVEVSNPVSNNPVFVAEVKPLEAGKVFELTVKSKPPYKRGNNSGTITLDTTFPEVPNITVPVGCYLADRVAISPKTIFVPFPHGPLSKGIKESVSVFHNVEGELKVSNLAVNSGSVKAEAVREVKNNRWRLEVTFEQGFVFPDNETLKLTFNTDDPSASAVEIPITNKPPAVAKAAASVGGH